MRRIKLYGIQNNYKTSYFWVNKSEAYNILREDRNDSFSELVYAWNTLKSGREVMLSTGAKLMHQPRPGVGSYLVHGYYQGGGDVVPIYRMVALTCTDCVKYPVKHDHLCEDHIPACRSLTCDNRVKSWQSFCTECANIAPEDWA